MWYFEKVLLKFIRVFEHHPKFILTIFSISFQTVTLFKSMKKHDELIENCKKRSTIQNFDIFVIQKLKYADTQEGVELIFYEQLTMGYAL